MSRQPVTFPGSHGALAGVIEIAEGPAHGYALFAHCFTCGKDSLAASRISRALAERGVSVLRFDFTGLGSSDGDVANAGFEGNVDDLVSAAAFLESEFAAPALLIGHSLGGTAALAAADRIPGCKAVVTIGAPAEPEHVLETLGKRVEGLDAADGAEVELGGRRFRLSRAFLDELRSTSIAERVRTLRRALLVMHSPVDRIVEIGQASEIFAAALHPKSFVSLDKADHLLTNPADAAYVAATIAGWAERYFEDPGPGPRPTTAVAPSQVAVTEANRKFLRRVATDDHTLLSDEPVASGGENLGPDPYELLLASLGSCTSMTIRMYANHKQWPLDDVYVELAHRRVHAADCTDCEGADAKIEVLSRRIRIDGDLDDAQRARLLEIADRCPVHRTLSGKLRIETSLVDGDERASRV